MLAEDRQLATDIPTSDAPAAHSSRKGRVKGAAYDTDLIHQDPKYRHTFMETPETRGFMSRICSSTILFYLLSFLSFLSPASPYEAVLRNWYSSTVLPANQSSLAPLPTPQIFRPTWAKLSALFRFSVVPPKYYIHEFYLVGQGTFRSSAKTRPDCPISLPPSPSPYSMTPSLLPNMTARENRVL